MCTISKRTIDNAIAIGRGERPRNSRVSSEWTSKGLLFKIKRYDGTIMRKLVRREDFG